MVPLLRPRGFTNKHYKPAHRVHFHTLRTPLAGSLRSAWKPVIDCSVSWSDRLQDINKAVRTLRGLLSHVYNASYAYLSPKKAGSEPHDLSMRNAFTLRNVKRVHSTEVSHHGRFTVRNTDHIKSGTVCYRERHILTVTGFGGVTWHDAPAANPIRTTNPTKFEFILLMQ